MSDNANRPVKIGGKLVTLNIPDDGKTIKEHLLERAEKMRERRRSFQHKQKNTDNP